MKTHHRLLFVALLVFVQSAAFAKEEHPAPLKVLFIGNSYTAANDLPSMVKRLADAAGGRKIRADRHLVGGCTLERHVKEKKAIDKIRAEKWDVVVLQEQSLRPVVNRKSMHEYARILAAEIKRQGAKTVFYLTWARQHIPEMQEGADPATSPEYAKAMFQISGAAKTTDFNAWCQQQKAGLVGGLNGAYFDIAKERNARVAPVGIAWKMALAADPSLVFHRPDKSHPNPTGTYLAACVFYATLLDKSPVGLPGEVKQDDNVLVSIPDGGATRLQRIAWEAVQGAAHTHTAAGMEFVRVADDNRSFILEKSGRKFVPWGFNYDHDGPGRLIEDYWDDEWPKIVQDFQEMTEFGATVVRIHLQFGKFMNSPDEPNQHSLQQLARLVKLAEQVGLYLDLTGLGCYHKQDVPPWYDKLDEEDRWAAQAAFWEAVAKTCVNSPAIFCYDLMNEPVVGGAKKRDDWLGGAFAGKHFVQFIVLETKGRPRHEIAKAWTSRLVAAIRKHDKRHLITVGLVWWSLDRPGLTSGFVPEKIAEDLDFIAMHIYPEKGKVYEALETVKGFAAVGKPVVIEETFPLKCSQDEMSRFIDESKSIASGWISFYWGKTPEECRKGGTIGEAIMANWLAVFPKKMAHVQSRFENVKCAGTYRHHLQGICTNDRDAIYWSFTTTLVKTDTTGKVLKQIPVGNHHGDLCHVDGKIYVAVNFGRFNDPKGNADSWVYVYDAKDLSLLAKHETQDVFHGAGGMGFRDGHFFVVGGLAEGIEENYVYEYDGDFKFVERHVINSGHTHLGIQTAAFANGQWWFGCYGDPKILLVTDADFKLKGRYEFDCSLGIVGLPDGRFLSASGRCEKDKGCWGSARLADADDRRGLTTIDEP